MTQQRGDAASTGIHAYRMTLCVSPTPWATSDPTWSHHPEKWILEQKSSESKVGGDFTTEGSSSDQIWRERSVSERKKPVTEAK